MKSSATQIAKYLFADALAAGLSYMVLFSYRKIKIQNQDYASIWDMFSEDQFSKGLLITCIFWIALYAITGIYKDIFRRSRLKEIFQTFNSSLFGSVIIFFVLILDDWVVSYVDYYPSYGVYLASIFTFTSTFRFVLSTRTMRRIQKKKLVFNTLLIGSNENAVDLFRELSSQKRSTGNEIVGFVSVYQKIEFLIEKDLPLLGSYDDLEKIIEDHQIEEVIIAIETQEHKKLEGIINRLENTQVRVKMIPDIYDIISGQVRLESLGAPLIEIKHELMPAHQWVAKRVFDVLVSVVLMVFISPVLLFISIMVKSGSKGPIFFSQERVGLQGKVFNIYKFRSMYEDAEQNGPQLSSEEDERITPWGRIMRKYRLDEIPQFYNVLIGDMAIVGPRPERQYYIDQIVEKAPYYKHVHKVKPGITSWGMVKFGYAENVDEMVNRLKYDIIYIENMSILNDVKILFYTILIVLQGRGK